MVAAGGGEGVKIYTRTGDEGETGLFGAGRVPKNHVRVDAYGQVDELNATIGFALALEPQTFCRELLETTQRDLFTIGAELATPDAEKLTKARRDRGPPGGRGDVIVVEQASDRCTQQVTPQQKMILEVRVANL